MEERVAGVQCSAQRSSVPLHEHMEEPGDVNDTAFGSIQLITVTDGLMIAMLLYGIVNEIIRRQQDWLHR